MKIQTKFLAFLIPAIILGFLIFGGITLFVVKKNVTDEINGNLEDVVNAQQYVVKHFIEDYESRFDVVALSNEFVAALATYDNNKTQENLDALNALLDSKKRQLGEGIRNITLVNDKGIIFASLEKNAVNTPYTEFAVSDFPSTKTIDFMYVEKSELMNDVVGPILLSGKRLAHLDIDIDQEKLLEGLYGFPGLGDTGNTVLIKKNSDNENYSLLEMVKSENGHIGTIVHTVNAQNPLFSEIPKIPEGVTKRFVGYFGKDSIGVMTRMPGSDWHILSYVTAAEAYQILSDIRNYTLIGLFIVLWITVLILLMLTASVTRPIQALIRAVQKYKDDRQLENLIVPKGCLEVDILANVLQDTFTEVAKLSGDLRTQAEQDVLTGLPNRRFFYQAITNLINSTEGTQIRFAIFYLVLDGIKLINETFGHEIGDKVLKAIAKRLKAFTSTDTLLARFDGDEFVFIVKGYESDEELTAKAAIMINTFIQPILVDEQVHRINVNIGIAQFPHDANTTTALLQYADTAMTMARRRHHNTYQFYTKAISEALERDAWLKNELIKAINTNGISMVYQPQIDLKNKKILGVEALMRWQHPTEGFIRPDEFIAVAEKNQLVHRLTEIAILDSFKDFMALKSAGIVLDKVSVNLSVQDFDQMDLPKYLLDCANQFKVPMSHFMLEITESLFTQDPVWIASILTQLKSFGFKIGLDDFGKGYSSLSLLTSLPIDLLKIDKAFVDDLLNEDKRGSSIALTIIELTKQLDKKVLAEGVETKDQVQWLFEHDCTLFQGYYFSKPLTLEDLIKFCQNWKAD